MRGWRTPKWKLVRDFFNEDRDELYDLSKDPEETNNLINSEKSVHQNILGSFTLKFWQKWEKLKDLALELARNAELGPYPIILLSIFINRLYDKASS